MVRLPANPSSSQVPALSYPAGIWGRPSARCHSSPWGQETRSRNLCWESFRQDQSSATWSSLPHLAVLVPSPAPSLSQGRGDTASEEPPWARPHEGFSQGEELATHSCWPNPAHLLPTLALPSWLLPGALPFCEEWGNGSSRDPHAPLSALPHLLSPCHVLKLTGTGKGARKKGI